MRFVVEAFGWSLNLQATHQEKAHIRRGDSLAMADWIKDYATKLGSDQAQENIRRQHDLLRDELIKAHGPVFFNALATELQAQGQELDTYAGAANKGVTVTRNGNTSATLRTGNGRSLSFSFNLGQREIGVESSSGRRRSLSFRADTDTNRVEVVCDSDVYGDQDIETIVTMLLKELLGVQ